MRFVITLTAFFASDMHHLYLIAFGLLATLAPAISLEGHMLRNSEATFMDRLSNT
ncbi:MAG: hypothetical protein P8N73_04885 [Pseudomonadales bacterium]|nr:hypothetical protein [Pseudomonadales bacterium]